MFVATRKSTDSNVQFHFTFTQRLAFYNIFSRSTSLIETVKEEDENSLLDEMERLEKKRDSSPLRTAAAAAAAQSRSQAAEWRAARLARSLSWAKLRRE